MIQIFDGHYNCHRFYRVLRLTYFLVVIIWFLQLHYVLHVDKVYFTVEFKPITIIHVIYKRNLLYLTYFIDIITRNNTGLKLYI